MSSSFAWRPKIAAFASVLIVTTMLHAPAYAAPEPGERVSAKPTPVPTVPVTAVKAKPEPVIKRLPSADRRPAPVWPAPESTTVDLVTAPSGARGLRAGSSPVTIKTATRTAKAASAAAAPGKVRVEVLDRAATARANVHGALIRLGRADGITAAAEAEVTVDYKPFANAYGADWASRLRLVSLPACALTTPGKKQCAATPLASHNDTTARTVTAAVPISATSSLLAVSAAPSGPTGDFSATSLQASSTWSAGGNTGAFTWSYPMRTPPAPGGTAPVVSLSYNSQSVDGRHAASNSQPSWVGEGFESVAGGFIERRYKPCARDMNANANNDRKTGDLCWETYNAVLSLNGSSGELIYNADEGKWHLRSDDGSRITRETGAANGDNDGEYWVVTTTDGTQYWFGSHRLPGWSDGDAVTNSTWTVPVFGNDPDEPCHATAFADSDCVQAWRWNLDYVVDPSGNSVSYWYQKETNKYGRNLDPEDDASYVRGGWLDIIQYGTRKVGTADSVFSTAAPARITFTDADRCLSSCTEHNGTRWPDTPWEQACTGSSCGDNYSPTFWTTRRLAQVTTQVRLDGAYSNVEQWTFTHRFPDPGDTTRAGLWLDKISHRGLVGGVASVPDIEFTEVQLANRVDTVDFEAAMTWMRIARIRNETGGTTSINYSTPACAAGQPRPAPHTNTSLCYPVIWEPEGNPKPVEDWFNKYVVETIYENDQTGGVPPKGSPRIVHSYKYLDGAAWHYNDDDGLIDKKYKTWSDFRGFGRVSVTVGDPGEQTYSETRYFRGMHGDRAAPSGGTRTVTVDGIADEDWYAGMTREVKNFNGPGGAVANRETSGPWASSATATRTINGDTVTARFTRTATTRKYTTLDAGRGERSTTTTTTYDNYGMAVSIDDAGLDGVSGDERCTKNQYNPRNTDSWMLDRVHRVQQYAVTCARAATPTTLTDADVMSEIRTIHDEQNFETAPNRGLVTRTEEMTAWNNGTPTFAAMGRAAYDVHGRATSVWDAMNFQTKTAYTPATGGPVTATKVTNPAQHETTTTVSPAWGLTTSIVDANGKRTEQAYDPLGRLTAVWLPGRIKGTDTANVTFGYHLSTTTATAVSTSKLNAKGQYVTSYQLYDGLLRARQTQSPSPSGGRLLTDAFYDTVGRESIAYSSYHATGDPAAVLATATNFDKVPTQNRKVYDGLGRVTATIFQPRGVERWRNSTSYAGDRIDATPPQGGTATSIVVDVHGRTSEFRQYHGPTPTPGNNGTWDSTSYQFNRKGQLDKVTGPERANNWTYTYDIRGRMSKFSDPDKGDTSYTYDNGGRLSTVTDARGKKIAYQYDNLNRTRAVFENAVGGTIRAQWAYDTIAKGQLSQSTRSVGSAPYQVKITKYNDAYQPTEQQIVVPASETGLAGTYTFNYTYNADGSVASTTYPDINSDLSAETLSYAYDDLGLPTTLETLYGGLDSTYVTRTDYNALAQVDQLVLSTGVGGNVNQAFTHELETGRLTGIRTDRDAVSPTVLADVKYEFAPAGNITMVKDTAPEPVADTQCFTYDHLQRLQHAWTPASGACTDRDAAQLGGPAPYWHEWTYDPSGNRKTQLVHSPSGVSTTNYQYPAAGSPQPHTLTSTSGAETGTYTYDQAGNTKTRPSTTGAQTLTWDPEGHLETSTDNTGETRYIYDADGNRLIRRDPTGSTLYLPGQEIRYTKSTAKTTCTRYYSHGGAVIASRTATALSWLTADAQGTAQVAVSAIGQVPTTRRQTPFGAPRGNNTAWPNERGFVGGTRDNTGLTHLGAREYDPGIGRFISLDPVMDLTDPQQIHGYIYANNNPITQSDPSGLDPGGGQCADTPGCKPSPTWGGPRPKDGGGSGSGGTKAAPLVGSTTVGDHNVERVREQNKKLFLATVTADSPICQAPGMGGECESARNAVKGGYDPYQAWVVLVCGGSGRSSTNCLNELGYQWNCGNAPCAELMINGGEVLSAAAGGVEAMGGRALLGGWRSVVQRPTLLETLSKYAAKGSGTAIGDFNSLGFKLARAYCSFSGDTPVLMADGTTKPISEIKVGDEVLATDPESDETGSREVTRLWIHEDEIVKLEVNGDELITTEDHPFWNETDRQWQRADELDRDDALLTARGGKASVGRLTTEGERETVYNLTVAAIHTYYVLAGKTPVLVHNNDCGDEVLAVGRNGADTTPQDWIPMSAWTTSGASLRRGNYTFVVMPDRSVRAFHESIYNTAPGAGHTSLSRRNGVLAAGTFDVDAGGAITRFDNYSGHYWPSAATEGAIRDAFGRNGFSLSGAAWDPFNFPK